MKQLEESEVYIMHHTPDKFVEFDKYCERCEHYEKGQHEDPCDECLNNPTNEWSRKPVKFQEKEVKKEKTKKKVDTKDIENNKE